MCRCLFKHPATQRVRDELKARLEVVKVEAKAAQRAGNHQHPSLNEAAVLYVRLFTPCEQT